MSRKLFLSNFPQKIREQIKNSQYHEVTIMRHSTETYTPDKTWLDLNQPHIFQPFFAGYLDLLQKKLPKVEVKGSTNYSYYCCGQDHYRRNPNWKPWHHLEWYCDKTRYDFSEARDMIFERIGRKPDCECELLKNDDEIRRHELKALGVDIGKPGKRDFGVL